MTWFSIPCVNRAYLITSPALEGFNNVPLLHPLETLHNNLTFHQVDDFLGRVCATRFPVPDMHALASLASKNNMELAVNTVKGWSYNRIE